MNKELLIKFGPKRGDKYSPNLYRWLIKHLRHVSHIEVYAAKDGELWIGTGPDGAWFHGVRMLSVLCNGGRAESMAYQLRQVGPMKLVDDFWDRYLRDGRCAIDRDHGMFFIGDEARWKVKGNRRECLWCGNCVQRRKVYTEKVKHAVWINNENPAVRGDRLAGVPCTGVVRPEIGD